MKISLSVPGTRIKAISTHSTRPWLLIGRITGEVEIVDYNSGDRIRMIHSGDTPVRAVAWLEHLGYFCAGDDSGNIRVYNMVDGSLVKTVQAHGDFIRALCVHPTANYIYSAGDDGLVVMWSTEPDTLLACVRVFVGHSLFAMSLALSADGETLYSAGLDETVRLWPALLTVAARAVAPRGRGPKPTQGTVGPNYTIKTGVASSAVAMHPTEHSHCLVGSDDACVRVYDRAVKDALRKVRPHRREMTCLAAGAPLPGILTGAEDGFVKMLDPKSLDVTDEVGLGARVWCIEPVPARRAVAVGTDSGLVILRLAQGVPAVAAAGAKLYAAAGPAGVAGGLGMGDRILVTPMAGPAAAAALAGVSESAGSGVAGGDAAGPLAMPFKPFGAQPLDHNVTRIQTAPSGRLVLVSGGDAWTVMSAIGGRAQAFGECVGGLATWAGRTGAGLAAVTDTDPAARTTKLEIRSSVSAGGSSSGGAGGAGTDVLAVELPVSVSALFGAAPLLAAMSTDGGAVLFLDPEAGSLIRQVNVAGPEAVSWAPGGRRLALRAADSLFVLAFDSESMAVALASGAGRDSETGEVPGALDLLAAIPGSFADCIFTDENTLLVADVSGNLEVHFLTSAAAGGNATANGGGALASRPAGRAPAESYLIDYLPEHNAVLVVAADGTLRRVSLRTHSLPFWRAVAAGDAGAAVAAVGCVQSEESAAAADALIALGAAAAAVSMLPPSQARIHAAVAAGDLAEAAASAEQISQSNGRESIPATAAWAAVLHGALQAGDIDTALAAGAGGSADNAVLLAACLGDDADLAAAAETALTAGADNLAFTAAYSAGASQTAYKALIGSDPAAAAQFARAYLPEKVEEAFGEWQTSLKNAGMSVIADSLLLPEPAHE